MNPNILKKKVGSFRAAHGTIRNPLPELLLELRQIWEKFSGPVDPFGRSTGALSQMLSRTIADSSVIGMTPVDGGHSPHSTEGSEAVQSPELAYDEASKVTYLKNCTHLFEHLQEAS